MLHAFHGLSSFLHDTKSSQIIVVESHILDVDKLIND